MKWKIAQVQYFCSETRGEKKKRKWNEIILECPIQYYTQFYLICCFIIIDTSNYNTSTLGATHFFSSNNNKNNTPKSFSEFFGWYKIFFSWCCWFIRNKSKWKYIFFFCCCPLLSVVLSGLRILFLSWFDDEIYEIKAKKFTLCDSGDSEWVKNCDFSKSFVSEHLRRQGALSVLLLF